MNGNIRYFGYHNKMLSSFVEMAHATKETKRTWNKLFNINYKYYKNSKWFLLKELKH